MAPASPWVRLVAILVVTAAVVFGVPVDVGGRFGEVLNHIPYRTSLDFLGRLQMFSPP
jgi:hypothetical protein